MSQRKFRYALEDEDTQVLVIYEVVAGWDRPLGRLHLTVYRLAGGEETVVWNCLRLPDPSVLSVPLIELVVNGLSPQGCPPGWVETLEQDVQRRAGNSETSFEFATAR